MKRDFDCDSYVPVKGVLSKSCAQYGYTGYCKSTKNESWCRCGGETSACDFYPEKRRIKMNTVEMMNQAQVDGKTYQYGDELFYTFETGFIDEDGLPFECSDLPMTTFSEFFAYEWHQVKSITRAEAEERLGIKIVG